MTWKSGGVLVLPLLLWTGVAASVDAVPDRAYWQAKYQRPAEIPFPEDNPYSAAKAELGEALFFDPILSGSRDALVRELSQPRPVVGRRPAARDRRGPEAARAAHADADRRGLDSRVSAGTASSATSRRSPSGRSRRRPT